MIAFDLDGTLVDSRHDLVDAVNVLRGRLSLSPLLYENAWQDVCRGMPHLYKKCFTETACSMQWLASQFEPIYLNRIFRKTTLFPGVVDTLEHLQTRFRLAVVTNKPQRATEALLEAANLTPYFTVIVGGDRCSEAKPSPIPLQFAFDAMGATDERFMIGDSNGDVSCGRSANAQTIWCRWGYWDEITQTPDWTVNAPDEIANIVGAKH